MDTQWIYILSGSVFLLSPVSAVLFSPPLALHHCLISLHLSGPRLRPGGRGLHPHLPGGFPSAAGEGSAGGEGRGAGVGVGEQDQAHQSLRHHPGQNATGPTNVELLTPTTTEAGVKKKNAFILTLLNNE